MRGAGADNKEPASESRCGFFYCLAIKRHYSDPGSALEPMLATPLTAEPATLTAAEPTVTPTLTAVLATETAAPATVTTVQPLHNTAIRSREANAYDFMTIAANAGGL